MELKTELDENGIIHLNVTPEHLEKFLLWRINTGILGRDGLRLVFDKMKDGSVKLKLLAVQNIEAQKFSYTDEAEEASSRQWRDFIKSLR